ncbi:hypothetical protein [Virgisporangium aurantiacum]|uniref:Uncharacterized protein n=1 Tax=Virgisporangium aurantiacum TaxID=175570 RepID=A0A8J3Z392_9ACTN|nr:hypothetical protein [Virgisporangium aurantiacum]GIJ55537.1 hypothetical protein Vau01_030530 [Virgisporangium aurantiacum]
MTERVTDRRYRRVVRRAFREVTFYRSQCAAAGRLLDEPVPTPTAAVPDPPYELCPFRRPWRPDRDLPLWTPDPRQLVGALRIAGLLPAAGTVVEVRRALVDLPRLTRRVRYAVLLGADAVAADRCGTNAATLDAVRAPVLLVGPVDWPDPVTVPRVDLARVADGSAPPGPLLLHDPTLGYLGARHPDCGGLHLDINVVHAAERDGRLAFSLLRRRRPTLLAMVPPGAGNLRLATCARHRTPVLEPVSPSDSPPG